MCASSTILVIIITSSFLGLLSLLTTIENTMQSWHCDAYDLPDCVIVIINSQSSETIMSLFRGHDEWRHPSKWAATFQYHPESERSMFSWDDLAVSSSWYPYSLVCICSSATTYMTVWQQKNTGSCEWIRFLLDLSAVYLFTKCRYIWAMAV